MSAPVITVTRQYASGGSEIARRVAGALGWTVIDNEFVDEVARRAGLPAAAVAERDERAPGLLERLARTLAVASPEMFISSQALAQPARDEATIVKLTERRRDQYVRTYYGRHRQDVVNYDLVVNTERLGLDGAAALVVAEARRRWP